MAKKHVINQDSNTSIQVKQNDGIWILKEGVTVDVAGGYGIDNAGGADNVEFVIRGALGIDNSTMARGFNEWGNNTRIEVTETGSIEAKRGIMSLGANIEIVNDGTISGSIAGLDISGKNYLIRNSGLLTTSDADAHAILIESAIASGKIVNEEDGIIDGRIANASSGPMTFINRGTFLDTPFGIDANLGYGDDRFVNSGTINGIISLGEGNDIADLRNGTGNGRVTGSGGNDTFIVNQNNAQALEYDGQGIDTLRTSVSFSAKENDLGEMERFVAIGKANVTIVANDYDNIIIGNRGRNLLDGGAGDDVLRGGKGADMFNFGTGHDSDRIMDFENGKDRIDVSGWDNIDDFADIKAIATVSGDDLVFAFGNDDITIRNMKMSELDAGDFIF
jgi:Ca2+-binding RTX toxin-like protein